MRFYLRIFTSVAGLLALSGVLAACVNATQGEPIQPDSPAATPTAAPSSETPPLNSAVPDAVLQPILADLSRRLGVDSSTFVVTKAESVVWGDGSLGCPEPGMMYTQALVNGYWVIIDANGQSYDYRASQGGDFRLCTGKGSGPIVGPGGAPISPDN